MKKYLLTPTFILLSISCFAQETLQTVSDRGNRTTGGNEINIPSLNSNKYLFLGGGTGYARIGAYDPTIGFDNLIVDAAKIGIGTASPIGKLDVRGATFIGTNDLVLGLSGSFIQIDQGNTSGNTHTQLRAYSNGGNSFNDLVLQNGGGNVGIGTTSPNQKLSVAGNILSSVGSNEGGALWLENSSKTVGNLGYRWAIYNMTGPYGNSLQFWSYNQDASVMGPKFAIGDNGNVLIGKTSQTNSAYLLDVNGKARANEIVVNTTGADFVFEKHYKLQSLVEVEAFIEKNKHLPEIPTARQMVENGVNLGELNIKLLQKVEELTLHLIEKEKQLKNEKEVNKKQQEQIDILLKKMDALENKKKK